jgi:PAS domain S-box-containing protein
MAEQSTGEEFRRLLLDHTPVGIWQITLDGTTVRLNRAMAKMLEVDDPAAITEPIEAYFTEESMIRIRAEHAKRRRGESSHYEAELVGRRGTHTHVLVSGVPVHDEDGEIRTMIATMVDLTDIRRAEAERAKLEKEREQLLAHQRLIFDRMPIAFIVCDPQFKCTYWNPAAERVFGFTKEEVLGTDPLERIGRPETRTARQEALGQLVSAGRYDTDPIGPSRNLTKSGREILCDWLATSLYDEQGAFLGVVGMAQDVTEKKRLEAQLLQAQKMECVGRLAGGVAHDFNNLLTAILGYADLAAAETPETSRACTDLEQIRRAGERAADLTRRLLSFARSQHIASKPVDLGALIIDLDGLLRRLIGEDVELSTVPSAEPCVVEADPTGIEQVLVNLVVNSRDAMPTGGKLTIATAVVSIGEAEPGVKPGRYGLLSVRDDGSGMSDEVKRHVFEPFFTTKDIGKGTGLGLASSYGIVAQYGGFIRFDSEVDRGTTFRVYMPCSPGRVREEGARPPSSTLPRGGETILIVEDEPLVRGLTGRVLTAQGYSVLEASDGVEAIRVAQSHAGPIHLLATDVVMPRLGGLELSRILTGSRPELRVMFMSGYTDQHVKETLSTMAKSDLLSKPFSVRTLTERVRALLDA